MASESGRNESAIFRGLRLIVLLSGGILAGMVQLAITPAVTEMAADLGKGGADGMLLALRVVTVPALVMAFGAPVTGWLAGRIGKRTVLLASLLAFAIGGGAGFVLSDFWALLVSRLFVGIGAAGFVTTSVASIGDYYAGETRDKLISAFAFVGGFGSLITVKAAGIISGVYGWHSQFLLYLVGVPLFFLAIYTLRAVRQENVVSVAEGIPVSGSTSIMAAWRIYLMIVLLSISMYVVTIEGGFLMDRKGLTDPSDHSTVLLMSTIGSMAGAFFFSYVRPVLGFFLVLAVVCGAFALGNIGFTMTSNVVLLAACAAAVGIGSGLLQPLSQTAVLNMLSPQASAGAVGVAIGCIFLGQFINPEVFKPLTNAFGLENATVYIGLASLTGAVLAVLWWVKGGMRRAAPAR
jgi:predicted MFS family arabinose efflux permease